jgi:hypothetical protein
LEASPVLVEVGIPKNKFKKKKKKEEKRRKKKDIHSIYHSIEFISYY